MEDCFKYFEELSKEHEISNFWGFVTNCYSYENYEFSKSEIMNFGGKTIYPKGDEFSDKASDDLKEKFNITELDTDFEGISEGDSVVPMKSLYDVDDESEHTIQYEDGKILIFQFFATFHPPTKNALKKTLEFLKEHQEYKDKIVHIICGLDNLEKIREYKQNILKDTETPFSRWFYSKEGFEGVCAKTYNKISFMTDMKGIIIKHTLDNLNPEDIIPKLIAGEFTLEKKEKKQNIPQLPQKTSSDTQFEESISKLKEYLKTKEEIIKKFSPKPTLNITRTTIYKNGEIKHGNKGLFSVLVFSEIEEEAQIFHKQLQDQFGEFIQWDIKIENPEKALVWIKEKAEEMQINLITLQMKTPTQIDETNTTRPIRIKVKGKEKDDQKRESFVKAIQEKYEGTLLNVETKIVSFGIGDTFIPIENATRLYNEEISTINHELGKVMLFDFWATWCGPCQGPMNHNQEMLENHPEWEGKVKIVGLGMDDEKENLIKRVEEKNWKKVTHYWMKGGFRHEMAEKYKVEGIPHCVLVNKQGLIEKIGHPMSMNLDETIPQLIEKEDTNEESKTSSEEEKGQCSLEEHEQIEKELFPLIQPKKYLFTRYYMNLSRIRKFVGNEMKSFSNLMINFVFFDNNEEEVEKLVAEIESKYGNLTKINFVKRKIKTYQLNFGNACNICEKELGKCKQYYCHECNIYLCKECGDKVNPEKSGIESLAHPHNLYFIQDESELAMKTIRFQVKTSNIQNEASMKHHGFGCDHCRKYLGGEDGIRWKCAICSDFDFCPTCFDASLNPESEIYKKMVEKKFPDHHDIKTHVYIRIYFEGMF